MFIALALFHNADIIFGENCPLLSRRHVTLGIAECARIADRFGRILHCVILHNTTF